MEDKRHNYWDIFFKGFTSILFTITVFGGILQFTWQQKNLKILEFAKMYTIDSLKFEQTIVEKRLEVYFSIGESIGIILSHDKNDSAFRKYIDDFEKLYYGEGLLIEDLSVNRSMKDFRTVILDYVNDRDISKFQVNDIGMTLIDSLKLSLLKRKSVYRLP